MHRRITTIEIVYNDGSPWPFRETSAISHKEDLSDLDGVYLQAVKSKLNGNEVYYANASKN